MLGSMTTSELHDELAAIEASEAEHLAITFDAWDILLLAERFPELRHRARCYGKFISLVSTYPDADIDMLLADARRVFRVRLKVMRADVALAKAIVR
jgi:hypothetical protein